MAEDSNVLAKKAEELEERTSADNTLTTVKALLSAVPIVGGAITSLMSDLIQEGQEKRLMEFTKLLADELTRQKKRLNEDFVKTEDFAHLWQATFKKVQEQRGEQKLAAYKNILVHGAIVNILPATVDQYLDVTSRLSEIELQVLSTFVDDTRNQPALAAIAQNPGGDLSSTIRTLCPELDKAQIERSIHVLDGEGITNKVAGSLQTMMTGHGATQLESRLTGYGRAFVNFVLSV